MKKSIYENSVEKCSITGCDRVATYCPTSDEFRDTTFFLRPLCHFHYFQAKKGFVVEGPEYEFDE